MQVKRRLDVAQFTRLLKEVLVVFKSDLPDSKLIADSSLVAKYPEPASLDAEKRRLRDFYDDFCIEVSLIGVQLESRHMSPLSWDTLWEVTKPVLDLFESMAPAGAKSRTPPTRFQYPFLRYLKGSIAQAQRQNKSFARLDEEAGGLLQYSLDNVVQDNSLLILRSCRKKLAKLSCFTGPSVAGEPALNADTGRQTRIQWPLPRSELGPHIGEWFRSSLRAFSDTIEYRGSTLVAFSLSQRTVLAITRLGPNSACRELRVARARRAGVRFVGLSDEELHEESDSSEEWTCNFCSLEQLLETRRISRKKIKLSLMVHLAESFLVIGNLYPTWREYKKFVLVDNDHYSEETLTLGRDQLLLLPPPSPNSNSLPDKAPECFGKIRSFLELGILLLELQLGQPIDQVAQDFSTDRHNTSTRNDYLVAWRFMDTPASSRIPEHIASAIRACLRCDFVPVEFYETTPQRPDVRRLAYESIVRPLRLEQILCSGEEEDSEPDDDMDADDESLPDAKVTRGTSTAPRVELFNTPTEGSKNWRVFDDQPVPDINSALADAWFARLSRFHECVIHPMLENPRFKSADFLKLKIAVLDTGLDLRDVAIRGAKDRIKEKRNWVPNAQGRVDTTDVADSNGHGTHVAALVLKVAPCADVCIARIAAGKVLDNGETYVAEAILWAHETCGADIITMSFGFPRYSARVEEAIEKVGKEVLFFAATRNDGGNRVVAYPADHRDVLGIFSTDGNGNKSGFNANCPDGDNSFFSTLGEAVESSWPKHLQEDGPRTGLMRKSGTSFATPIAAAIAANTLDYARIKLDMGEKYLKRMRRIGKMIDVLRLMAPVKRDGYWYLAPWNLWKMVEDEYATEEDLELEQTGIRTDILKLLR